MAPVASGAGSRGKQPKKATAEIAAPAETPGREAASAKPQGTIAPVPKPTIAKPTTLVAKPRWAADQPEARRRDQEGEQHQRPVGERAIAARRR